MRPIEDGHAAAPGPTVSNARDKDMTGRLVYTDGDSAHRDAREGAEGGDDARAPGVEDAHRIVLRVDDIDAAMPSIHCHGIRGCTDADGAQQPPCRRIKHAHATILIPLTRVNDKELWTSGAVKAYHAPYPSMSDAKMPQQV